MKRLLRRKVRGLSLLASRLWKKRSMTRRARCVVMGSIRMQFCVDAAILRITRNAGNITERVAHTDVGKHSIAYRTIATRPGIPKLSPNRSFVHRRRYASVRKTNEKKGIGIVDAKEDAAGANRTARALPSRRMGPRPVKMRSESCEGGQQVTSVEFAERLAD